MFAVDEFVISQHAIEVQDRLYLWPLMNGGLNGTWPLMNGGLNGTLYLPLCNKLNYELKNVVFYSQVLKTVYCQELKSSLAHECSYILQLFLHVCLFNTLFSAKL